MMASEIFKLDASRAEKLTKTRVQFLLTPTVGKTNYNDKCNLRKQTHKPHKARPRDIKSKKLKSFLLWIYCRWPVICSKQGAIWLSWGLWRKKILPEILEASVSSKTYTICNSHLTFKYLQYIPSWNGNKYFDLVINLQNHIFENSISKFK